MPGVDISTWRALYISVAVTHWRGRAVLGNKPRVVSETVISSDDPTIFGPVT